MVRWASDDPISATIPSAGRRNRSRGEQCYPCSDGRAIQRSLSWHARTSSLGLGEWKKDLCVCLCVWVVTPVSARACVCVCVRARAKRARITSLMISISNPNKLFVYNLHQSSSGGPAVVPSFPHGRSAPRTHSTAGLLAWLGDLEAASSKSVAHVRTLFSPYRRDWRARKRFHFASQPVTSILTALWRAMALVLRVFSGAAFR